MSDPNCFGFYGGNHLTTCSSCTAVKRCKAILISDGFDVLGDIVNQLTLELPAGTTFRDTDRVSEMLKQLQNPPAPLTKEEAELLNLTANADSLADVDI